MGVDGAAKNPSANTSTRFVQYPRTRTENFFGARRWCRVSRRPSSEAQINMTLAICDCVLPENCLESENIMTVRDPRPSTKDAFWKSGTLAIPRSTKCVRKLSAVRSAPGHASAEPTPVLINANTVSSDLRAGVAFLYHFHHPFRLVDIPLCVNRRKGAFSSVPSHRKAWMKIHVRRFVFDRADAQPRMNNAPKVPGNR